MKGCIQSHVGLSEQVVDIMSIDIKLFHAIICAMNNNQESKRTYQMSKRAETAAETERAIFAATADLWCERAFADITLDAIAERAGVSVRTIIRRYGSRDGLFITCIQNSSDEIESDREKAEVGDIEGAIHYLLKDYEAYGDTIIRTLAVEYQIEAAQKVIQAGRDYHRD